MSKSGVVRHLAPRTAARVLAVRSRCRCAFLLTVTHPESAIRLGDGWGAKDKKGCAGNRKPVHEHVWGAVSPKHRPITPSVLLGAIRSRA